MAHSETGASENATIHDAAWQRLSTNFPGVCLRPFFERLETAVLENLEQRAIAAGLAPRLTAYFAIVVPDDIDAAEVVKAVAEWPHVQLAYLESGPVPPPVNPGDDPMSGCQGYLSAAPVGIDAYSAWADADGSGVGFVDLEQGWTLNHEDLPTTIPVIGSGSFLEDPGWVAHGTAVLGIVAAVDNAKGVIGIAPECSVRVVSQWFKNSAGAFFSTADGIASAVAQMKAGDVLLLETTAPPVSKFGWVPVDTDPICFLLIKIATSIGITVVEPAGNNGVKADTPHIGGSNLDAFTDPQGKFILNRANPYDLKDSGAIMVGAASSAVPHTRMAFSNYGSRIDCYAWGENIATCGGWGLTPQTAYMINFAGTSGASAIVAGAAVLLQSWALKHKGGPLGTAALRSILSDASLNTPSQNPTVDRIGVMPDLKRLIQHLNGSRVPSRLAAIIALLIGGIAQDGGGWKWTPGGGLTPVGPRTDKQGNGLSSDQRDMIIGMTVLELASLVSDVSDRQILEKASAALILDTAGRITGKIGEQ